MAVEGIKSPCLRLFALVVALSISHISFAVSAQAAGRAKVASSQSFERISYKAGLESGAIAFSPTAQNHNEYFAAALEKRKKGKIAKAVASVKPQSASTAQQAQTSENVWSTSSDYSGGSGNPPLEYFGGVVASDVGRGRFDPMRIKLIYYGKKWTRFQKSVVGTFIRSLTPKNPTKDRTARTLSNWWAITTRYYHDAKNKPITKYVTLDTAMSDLGTGAKRGRSAGSPLTMADLQSIVVKGIKGPLGLPDDRAVYLLLTDEDTHVENFCNAYCSFHTTFKYARRNAVVLFVGNPAVQCPYNCSFEAYEPRFKAPNEFGVDAALNFVAHGLTAVATDTLLGQPVKPGWVVQGTTIENADFCYFDFGNFGFTKTYAFWNVKGLNDMRFFIQRNWNLALQACTMTASGQMDGTLPTTPS